LQSSLLCVPHPEDGIGFGRVLQLVHVRAWRLKLSVTASDYGRFAIVLLGVYGLILILMVQLAELTGHPAWIGYALIPGWIALLTLFFVSGCDRVASRLLSGPSREERDRAGASKGDLQQSDRARQPGRREPELLHRSA
jgi:hypothetical protein